MRLDVVMPTWNSNAPYFKVVTRRVIERIPINRFILVDRYSSDGTVEQVKAIVPPDKLIIIETDADLARARAIGIKYVSTEYFIFIDSDILIPHNFDVERWVRLMMVNNRLAVISFPIISVDSYAKFATYKRHVRISRILKKYEEVTSGEIIKYGLFRLTAGDLFLAILRTSVVKDWQPPPHLSALEVFSLTQHVLGKGYLWVEIAIPVVHLKELKYGAGPYRHLKQGLWTGGNARILNIPKEDFFLETFSRFFLGTVRRILARDPMGALNNVFFRIGYLVGYLSPYKYRVWVR